MTFIGSSSRAALDLFRPSPNRNRSTSPLLGLFVLRLHLADQLWLAGRRRSNLALGGDGFAVLAQEGQEVAVGEPVVRWDPLAVTRRGLSTICPVVALDASAEVIGDPASGSIARGNPIFTWA